ncbi:MAG: tetratricopeptide repeat protein [Candidatus Thioglobus sp.]|nr:MAG: tetratricopeptide repeat protein [Candidatus Thioglobus sp.]
MKNFIDIVRTDEEQEEQTKKWIRENLPIVAIGVALGLAGIWGFDYYKGWEYQQTVKARIGYLFVTNHPEEAAGLKALKINHPDSNYTQLATMIMAKKAVNNGDYQAAIDYLLPLENSDNVFIAKDAKFKIASIYLEIGKSEKALSTLGSNENKAFAALYNNLKGDIYFSKNDFDSAKKYYQLTLAALSNNSKLKNLVQIKLNDLN